MNNEVHTNRLESEIAGWNSKEDRLKKLFKSSSSLENSLLKEKLRFYESILLKYKNTNQLDERTALQIIRNERNALIKKIYPDRFRQYFYKLMSKIVAERINARKESREELISNQLLTDNLERSGFKEAYNKVNRYMRLGQDKFTVPISYYLNEHEQMNHSLHFIKNEQGHYDFKGFNSSLHHQNGNNETRQYYFDVDEVKAFNSEQAYELLSGRAVLTARTWKQLDFNQKGVDNNYQLEEFHESYGFNIEKSVSQLFLKTSDQSEINSLIDSLKEGRREAVTLTKEGTECKDYIEANPQHKCLNIYNENLRKVTVESLFRVKRDLPLKLQSSLKLEDNKVKSKCRKI
jgi:hypothetical protein